MPKLQQRQLASMMPTAGLLLADYARPLQEPLGGPAVVANRITRRVTMVRVLRAVPNLPWTSQYTLIMFYTDLRSRNPDASVSVAFLGAFRQALTFSVTRADRPLSSAFVFMGLPVEA